MSDIALLVQLQARVTAFLASLSADRLLALAQGQAVLTISDVGRVPADGSAAPPSAQTPQTAPERSTAPRGAASGRRGKAAAGSFDAETVAAQLRASETVDEATERLAAFKLTGPQLKDVARTLNIPVSGTKPELSRRILNLTVGARSKHAGLQRG